MVISGSTDSGSGDSGDSGDSGEDTTVTVTDICFWDIDNSKWVDKNDYDYEESAQRGSCPHCGNFIYAESGLSGLEVECPHCRKVILLSNREGSLVVDRVYADDTVTYEVNSSGTIDLSTIGTYYAGGSMYYYYDEAYGVMFLTWYMFDEYGEDITITMDDGTLITIVSSDWKFNPYYV